MKKVFINSISLRSKFSSEIKEFIKEEIMGIYNLDIA